MNRSHRAIAAAALLVATSIGAGAALTSPASAQTAVAAHVLVQQPDIYDLQIGNVRVTALSDGSVPQDLHTLLHRTTAQHTDELLARNFQANPVEASLNAYLVRLPGRLVLVDTGSGQLFGPGNGGKLIDALTAAGVRPDQISDVLITHIHDDHVGGLVKDGQRVFRNATVHVGKGDVDYFFDPKSQVPNGYPKKYFDEASTTMKPYLDAGKVKTFTGTQEVLPGITGTVHAGHTPGSAFFTLTSNGERLVFVGDIVHVASVQFPDPSVTIEYDQDENGAARVRQQTFAEFARTREMIAVPHLPFPGIGHVRAEGRGYAWVPIVYTNRAGQ